MAVEGFPKEIALRDGSRVTLRAMVAEDRDKLLAFFRGLSPEDRQFLRDDVTSAAVIEKWARELNYDRVLPILAEAEGRVVGDATLHRDVHGWMRHVGEIRVVTAREYRRRGLATALAREIFTLAVKAGLDKMVAEMVADQVPAIKVFERLGFRQEARLADHVIDLKGKKHDLVIMSTDIASLMRRLEEVFEGGARPMED